jgi:hypothetical protein
VASCVKEGDSHMLPSALCARDIEWVRRLDAQRMLKQPPKLGLTWLLDVGSQKAGSAFESTGKGTQQFLDFLTENEARGMVLRTHVFEACVDRQSALFGLLLSDAWSEDVRGKAVSRTSKTLGCWQCGAMARQGGKTLLLCEGCKLAAYCSKECQQKHWKQHEQLCCRGEGKAAAAGAGAGQQAGSGTAAEGQGASSTAAGSSGSAGAAAGGANSSASAGLQGMVDSEAEEWVQVTGPGAAAEEQVGRRTVGGTLRIVPVQPSPAMAVPEPEDVD